MASESVTVTDAVVTDLNAESWPVAFTAERKYLSPLDRATMGSAVYVHAFPLTLVQEKAGRGSNRRTYGIAIMVRKAIDPAVNADVDVLIETIEKMTDRYQDLKRIGTTTVESVEPLGSGGELYDADQLATVRVFVGGILLTLNHTE